MLKRDLKRGLSPCKRRVSNCVERKYDDAMGVYDVKPSDCLSLVAAAAAAVAEQMCPDVRTATGRRCGIERRCTNNDISSAIIILVPAKSKPAMPFCSPTDEIHY